MGIATVGLAEFLLALCCGACAAAAEECPKTDGPITDEDLRATPDCAAAVALHARCSLASRGRNLAASARLL
jgi:hypothetical protein